MKIILLGYGKMGQAIENEAIKKGHVIEKKISSTNKEAFNPSMLKTADVAIEFSRPEVAFHHIKTCLEAGLPVVSGTTGWLHQLEDIEEICYRENGAFLYASNFSIGVHLFFQLNKYLARLMESHAAYEPGITEIHHTQKLDAPSGTAITLAKGLLSQHTRKTSWTLPPPETDDQLVITAQRIENVPGTHIVSWTSAIDTIEIKHTAHSRKGFVEGALMAAEWIIGKKGCFGMEDVMASH